MQSWQCNAYALLCLGSLTTPEEHKPRADSKGTHAGVNLP